MGVKRGSTTTPAQTTGKAKKNKTEFFKSLNLPSTSTSSERALGKQDSEPHGGQPAVDSQESLDNVPVTVSCPTLAETITADEEPLAKRTAINEVVDPDTDKESHMVLQDIDMTAGIPETQIDMPDTKAEDMHTGEPNMKPTDKPAEEVPDGFTTPPMAALRSLTEAIDSESDPEMISKYFQNMNGTKTRLGVELADSLEANFETLAGKFAGLDTDLDKGAPLDAKSAKKVEALGTVVNNEAWDPKTTYAQAFRREHAKDPMYHTLGRAEQHKFKVDWAKTQLRTLTTEHTKTESFSRIDKTKGNYRNFSQLVVSQGGI